MNRTNQIKQISRGIAVAVLLINLGWSAALSAQTGPKPEVKAGKIQETLLIPIGEGEQAQNIVRERLQNLSLEEALKFVSSVGTGARDLAGKPELQGRVLRSYDVLRRRADVDAAVAAKILSSFSYFEKSSSKKRLEIFLMAKAGTLTQARIAEELKSAAVTSTPSDIRLSMVSALTDAMSEAELTPTIAHYESLLKSDVSAIRVHAVQWFQLSPLDSQKDRVRFFKLALTTKPYQARAQAYKIISSLKPNEIRALEKAGAFQRAACEKESAAPFTEICRAIDSKVRDLAGENQ